MNQNRGKHEGRETEARTGKRGPDGGTAGGFFASLEALVSPAAVTSEWELVAGMEMRAARRFVRPTQRKAVCVPCTQTPRCGCRHEVVHLGEGGLRAVCRCDSEDCPTVALGALDVVVHELDPERLCREVRAALGFGGVPPARLTEAQRVWRAGAWGTRLRPVLLCLASDELALLGEVATVAAVVGEPFVLMTAAGRHVTPRVEAAIRRQQGLHLALKDWLTFSEAGELKAMSSPTAALTEWERRLSQLPDVPKTLAGTQNEIGSVRTKTALRPGAGAVGRLKYDNGFNDIWFGGVHHDLRQRNQARYCIQYLVEAGAFEGATARHLETEIEPFVRKKARLPALPASSITNVRIQRYFNDPTKRLQQLRKELIKAEGRTGRFYLDVN
jgi:hypothetical protein